MTSTKLRIFLVLAILVVLGVALTFPHLKGWLTAVVEWTAGLGAWGAILFVVLFTVATVFLMPASVMCVGAGAVFGLVKGTALVLAGSVLGATAAFLVGRYFARDWVKAKVAHHPHFAAIDAAVAREGWKIVLLARLCPIFPFILLNYALGLTSVRLGHYVFASAIGMVLPMTVLVYLGSLANAATTEKTTPAKWALYGVGLVAIVVTTIYLTRLARRALNEKLPDQTDAP
jgi:uncharacterized membrane protein YdjX (TVP38/TMEM64 family)